MDRPSSIGVREVERLAALARLALSAGEGEAMSEQLSSILAHLEALRGVEPDAPVPAGEGPGAGAPLREDAPGFDPLLRPPAEMAPAWGEPFYLVPAARGGGGEPSEEAEG